LEEGDLMLHGQEYASRTAHALNLLGSWAATEAAETQSHDDLDYH
jgi:hypothetical protein